MKSIDSADIGAFLFMFVPFSVIFFGIGMAIVENHADPKPESDPFTVEIRHVEYDQNKCENKTLTFWVRVGPEIGTFACGKFGHVGDTVRVVRWKQGKRYWYELDGKIPVEVPNNQPPY